MTFTWGEEDYETAGDQKAEYVDDYCRKHVTTDKVQDALSELYLDDAYIEITAGLKSQDEGKIGALVIAYLEKALEDDAEDYAEKQIEANAESIRRMM